MTPLTNEAKRTGLWVFVVAGFVGLALQFCGTSSPAPQEPSQIPPDILRVGRPAGIPIGPARSR